MPARFWRNHIQKLGVVFHPSPIPEESLKKNELVIKFADIAPLAEFDELDLPVANASFLSCED